ncbi:hypothetical protein [Janthinobacterium sp.]|uniref:hypothetical protein n=1 Tax=Janthinobacterium sp. TaxID=1871054 RepID=UPI0025C3E022|nr:hypothetical protein [Janthinobacterium sp.]
MRRRGQMGLTLTPVNWDCTYLRREVEAGTIDEVHARLEARNLIPIGTDRPLTLEDPQTGQSIPMDQAWIDEQRRITPERWAAVILDGEWEGRPEGVFFRCFDPKRHVVVGRIDPRLGPVRHLLGFDYAAADREIGHCCTLVQVQDYRDDNGRTRQRILALDEVAMEGHATNEHFAREVVAMLARNGLRWSDLYAAHGDNPVTSVFVKKSNSETMKAIAAEIGIPKTALRPEILSAKDNVISHASFDASCQWVFERIASDALHVNARCKTLIRGLETWDYTKHHPHKDILDSLRYALKTYVFPYGGAANVTVRVR